LVAGDPLADVLCIPLFDRRRVAWPDLFPKMSLAEVFWDVMHPHWHTGETWNWFELGAASAKRTARHALVNFQIQLSKRIDRQ
jgi:hypothetical protein